MQSQNIITKSPLKVAKVYADPRTISQQRAMESYQIQCQRRKKSTKPVNKGISNIANQIVAEIQATQKNSTLNTSNMSIESETNNLHILLSNAGRHQIKLHLEQIDSRFQTEIGKLYMEWKNLSPSSQNLQPVNYPYNYNHLGQINNNNNNNYSNNNSKNKLQHNLFSKNFVQINSSKGLGFPNNNSHNKGSKQSLSSTNRQQQINRSYQKAQQYNTIISKDSPSTLKDRQMLTQPVLSTKSKTQANWMTKQSQVNTTKSASKAPLTIYNSYGNLQRYDNSQHNSLAKTKQTLSNLFQSSPKSPPNFLMGTKSSKLRQEKTKQSYSHLNKSSQFFQPVRGKRAGGSAGNQRSSMHSLKSNKVLSSTVIIDPSSSSYSTGQNQNQRIQNPNNQSQIMQSSYSYHKRIDEEEEDRSPSKKSEAEIRKVASNPQFTGSNNNSVNRSNASPKINNNDQFYQNKGSTQKRGMMIDSFDSNTNQSKYQSSPSRKAAQLQQGRNYSFRQNNSSGTKGKIKEDSGTPQQPSKLNTNPQPHPMSSQGRIGKQSEFEYFRGSTAQNNKMVDNKLTSSCDRSQQNKSTSRLQQSSSSLRSNQPTNSLVDSSKVQDLILQIDKYNNLNNGKIPPKLRQQLNSFSQQIAKHLLFSDRSKPQIEVNPNRQMLSKIKSNAVSRLNKNSLSTSKLHQGSSKMPTTQHQSQLLVRSPKQQQQARAQTRSPTSSSRPTVLQNRFQTRPNQQIKQQKITRSPEQKSYKAAQTDYDVWLQLLTSRRLNDLIPCMKSHKIALYLGICIMYLLADMDKTILLTPDKKKLAGKTWNHVQSYMSSTGKVVGQLKRLKSHMLNSPKINEHLMKELNHYWSLAQMQDKHDIEFFEDTFNFVNSAVQLFKLMQNGKLKPILLEKKKAAQLKKRSKSFGHNSKSVIKGGSSFLYQNSMMKKVYPENEMKISVMNELDQDQRSVQQQILQRQRQIQQAKLKILELKSVKNRATWQREKKIKNHQMRNQLSMIEQERQYKNQQRRKLLEGQRAKEQELLQTKRDIIRSDVHNKRVNRLRTMVQDKKQCIEEFQRTVNDIEYKEKQKKLQRKKKEINHQQFLQKIEHQKNEKIQKFKEDARKQKKERLERQKQDIDWQYHNILKQREDLEKELLLLSKF